MNQWKESVNKVEQIIESCTNVIQEQKIQKKQKGWQSWLITTCVIY